MNIHWKKSLSLVGAVSILVMLLFLWGPTDQTILAEEDVRMFVSEQYEGSIQSLKEVKSDQSLEYEIELESRSGLYLLRIDAVTGEVRSLEKVGENKVEAEERKPLVLDMNTITAHIEEQIGEKIQIETYELDEDDGERIYYLTIRQKHGFSEVEVDAMTGDILVYKMKEDLSIPTDPHVTPVFLTEEEARRIAETHVTGVFDDIDLEEEDGRFIYEVEFEEGDLDIELKMDAITGEIMSIKED